MKKVLSIIGAVMLVVLGLIIGSTTAQGKKNGSLTALFNLGYTAPVRIVVTLDTGVDGLNFVSSGDRVITYDANSQGKTGLVFTGLYSGDTFNYENPPSRSGYMQVGWKYKVKATDQWSLNIVNASNASTTIIPFTDHLYLQAVWAKTYSVSFDNGTGVGGLNGVEAGYGFDMPTISTLPTRTGYTFDGYYYNEIKYYNDDGTSAHTYDIGDDVTLTAQWTGISYAVTSGMNGYTGSVTVANSGTFGSELPISWSAGSATGYTYSLDQVTVYSGSNTSGEVLATYNTDTSATFTMSGTYYSSIYIYVTHARQANPYTLTANANGGSISSTTGWTGIDDTATKGVTYDGTYGTLPTVTRTGYTFNGWFTESSGGTQVTEDTTYTTANNSTIYAHWTLITYNVTISSNNTDYGTISGGTNLTIGHGSIITVNNNQITFSAITGGNVSTTITATPHAEDSTNTYAFTGWSVSDETQVTGAMNITATFKATPKGFAVTIQASDNGAYGTVNQSSVTVPEGSAITTSENKITIGDTEITATPATDNGAYVYRFANWSGVENTVTRAFTITANFARFTISNGILTGYSGSGSVAVIPSSVTSIGDNVFALCSGLTSITIPDSVTSIGARAFLGCSGLTSVTIPDSVTSIGSAAFSGCSGLTGSLTIPDGVESIGSSAFYNCSGLTSITIPDSVESIESSAFYGCSSLNYENYNNADYLGNSNNPYVVLVKATNTSITSCTINPSCKVIYYQAFQNCSGLTSITIPDSVTSIGIQAFYNCTGLTSITIDAATPPTLGYSAFDDTNDCPIYVPAGSVDAYKAASGWSAYASRIQAIPNNFTVTIRSNNTAFGTVSQSSVTVPEGTTITTSGNTITIGGITVTASAESGYQRSYWGMPSKTVTSNMTIIAYFHKPTASSDLLISGSLLTGYIGSGDALVIPRSVTSIDDNAFFDCGGLTSIIIPDSVTSIGDYAFDSCSGLTSITIPDSVTYIGSEAFYGCGGLTSVTIDAATPPTLSASNAFNSTNNYPIYVPAGSVDAYKAATNWSSYASRIQAIPNGFIVTIRSNNTAYGTVSQSSVTAAEGATITTSGNTITIGGITVTASANTGYQRSYWEIPSKTVNCNMTITAYFHAPTALSDFTINWGSTLSSYNGNSSAVVIPRRVAFISNHAFLNKSNLTSVIIPDSVFSIESDAFRGCTSLTSITIPDSVTSIGTNAFGGCTGLTSVTIGSGVTSIEGSAFSNCSALTYNNYDNAKYLGNSNNPYLVLVKATNTSITSCTINPNCKVICGSAFANCGILTSITIPDGVTSICGAAFYNCTGLTGSLTIPNSVTRIGDMAFYNCHDLTSITIGSGVTFIGGWAFQDCSGLTSVTIGSGVTDIGIVAFTGCSSLTYFEFKSNPTNGGLSWYYGTQEIEDYNPNNLATFVKGNNVDGYGYGEPGDRAPGGSVN